jgi:hypothetical protein
LKEDCDWTGTIFLSDQLLQGVKEPQDFPSGKMKEKKEKQDGRWGNH